MLRNFTVFVCASFDVQLFIVGLFGLSTEWKIARSALNAVIEPTIDN